MEHERAAVVVVGAALDGRDPAPQRLAPVRLPLMALEKVQVVNEGDAVPEDATPHLLQVLLRHGKEGGARDVVLAERFRHELHVYGNEVLVHHFVDSPFWNEKDRYSPRHARGQVF